MLPGVNGGNGTHRAATIRTAPVQLYSTAPTSKDAVSAGYLDRVIETARWSEEAGCTGSLVYTDNGLVDPWLVAQVILQNTKRLCPLVAVQPIYMHPYTVAKMISTLAFLHHRKVCLNMVAGGFKGDLLALNDATPHDKRYDRLVEYTLIIKRLLSGEKVSFSGEFHSVQNLMLTPALPPELFPDIFISGSSDAGLAASAAIGAVAVKYPEPAEQCPVDPSACHPFGVRVGIIARGDEREAWEIADQRFPDDRRGQMTHKLAMSVSDSKWHQQLSDTGAALRGQIRSTYWLGPFENYRTFCPYLVGSYGSVSSYLRQYLNAGYTKFILDIPPSQEELLHTMTVFRLAGQETLQ